MEGCAETGSTGRIIEGLWSMDNRGKLTVPISPMAAIDNDAVNAIALNTAALKYFFLDM